MKQIAPIWVIVALLAVLFIWLYVKHVKRPKVEPIRQAPKLKAGPAHPAVNEGEASSHASESAASQAKRVARLGQLYGVVCVTDNTEKRTELLVEYLEILRSLRRDGQPDMKPPAFLTYDQARVKLVEALNERFDELVAGAGNTIEDFDRLESWLDGMDDLTNQFNLDGDKVDAELPELRDLPEAWGDWLIYHYPAPTFVQFRRGYLDDMLREIDDLHMVAVSALMDPDEYTVKFIRAICLASPFARTTIGETTFLELTKLVVNFNKEHAKVEPTT